MINSISVLDSIYKAKQKPLHILIGKFQPVAYLHLDTIRNILNDTEGRLLIFICSPKESFDKDHILSFEEICNMLEKYFNHIDSKSGKGFQQRLLYRKIRFTGTLEEWAATVETEINKTKTVQETPVLWGTNYTSAYYKNLFPNIKLITEVTKIKSDSETKKIRNLFMSATSGKELENNLQQMSYAIPSILATELVKVFNSINTAGHYYDSFE